MTQGEKETESARESKVGEIECVRETETGRVRVQQRVLVRQRLREKRCDKTNTK